MKKIIAIAGGTLVLGGLLTVLLTHPVNVLANPFSPAETRLSAELRQEVEARYPGTTVVEIDLDLDGFDLYLSNGVIMEVGFFGRIDPVVQTWNGQPVTQVMPPVNPVPSPRQAVSLDTLPVGIALYLEANYPNANVIALELERNEYNIYLDNGIELYFTSEGAFRYSERSDDLDDYYDDDEVYVDPAQLPLVITEYLAANYPTATIQFVEIEEGGYEVYLSNGLEITFTPSGQVIDIDQG